MSYDAGYANLDQYIANLRSYLSADLTESDTRAKFIDVFLQDVLEWDERSIRRERRYWQDGTRAAIDYEVGQPSPLFLVEAKRHKVRFGIDEQNCRFLQKLAPLRFP